MQRPAFSRHLLMVQFEHFIENTYIMGTFLEQNVEFLVIVCRCEMIRTTKTLILGEIMKLRELAMAGAALTMAAAPVAAQAQSSDDDGRSTWVTAAIVGAIAAIGMIILIVSDDDDDDVAVSA